MQSLNVFYFIYQVRYLFIQIFFLLFDQLRRLVLSELCFPSSFCSIYLRLKCVNVGKSQNICRELIKGARTESYDKGEKSGPFKELLASSSETAIVPKNYSNSQHPVEEISQIRSKKCPHRKIFFLQGKCFFYVWN